MTNYTEAKDEAERLSRVTNRNVEVTSINCDCNYSRNCGRCAGEGLYYELVYGFCDHRVKDDDRDELECRDRDCAERERAARDIERSDSFPIRPLLSCREVATAEEEELEMV